MTKNFLASLPTYPISLVILELKFALREGAKNIQRGGTLVFRVGSEPFQWFRNLSKLLHFILEGSPKALVNNLIFPSKVFETFPYINRQKNSCIVNSDKLKFHKNLR